MENLVIVYRFLLKIFDQPRQNGHNSKDTGIIGNVILFLICLCFWKWQLVEKKLHPDDILTSWYCMVVIKMPSWFDEFFFWFVCLFVEITIIWELHFVVDYFLLPSFSKLVWHFPASYHRQLCQVSWFLVLKSPHLWALEKSNYGCGVSVCTSWRKVHFSKKKLNVAKHFTDIFHVAIEKCRQKLGIILKDIHFQNSVVYELHLSKTRYFS